MVEHDGCKGCRYEKFQVTSSHCQGCTQNSIDKYTRGTNADRIRSMSDEELANENIYFVPGSVAREGLHYTGLNGRYYKTSEEVVEANKKWLQSEAEAES